MRGRSSLRLDRMDALAQPTILPVQPSLNVHLPVFCATMAARNVILPRAWKVRRGWGGRLTRTVSPRRLPQLNRIALRVVDAGKPAARVMLRVYVDRDARCPYCAAMASRPRTRKLTIHICLESPK